MLRPRKLMNDLEDVHRNGHWHHYDSIVFHQARRPASVAQWMRKQTQMLGTATNNIPSRAPTLDCNGVGLGGVCGHNISAAYCLGCAKQRNKQHARLAKEGLSCCTAPQP